jgi:hypothetical protein
MNRSTAWKALRTRALKAQSPAATRSMPRSWLVARRLVCIAQLEARPKHRHHSGDARRKDQRDYTTTRRHDPRALSDPGQNLRLMRRRVRRSFLL